MKTKYLRIVAIYLLSCICAIANNPLDNVAIAIETVYSYIDQGKATNYHTNLLIKRDQLELLEVEYWYSSSQRRIAVTFMEKATIKHKDGKTTCKSVTFYMDDKGNISDGIGYGDRTFTSD